MKRAAPNHRRTRQARRRDLVILHAMQERSVTCRSPPFDDAAASALSRAESMAYSRSITISATNRRPPCAEAVPRRGVQPPRAMRSPARAKPGSASRSETRGHSRVTLEPIYCLGLCATAPSAMLDGRVATAGRIAPRCAGCGGAAMKMRIFVPRECRRDCPFAR